MNNKNENKKDESKKDGNKKNISIEFYEAYRAYSIEEVASILGMGKTKTRELLSNNEIRSGKVGKQYVTSYQDIQNFLKSSLRKKITY